MTDPSTPNSDESRKPPVALIAGPTASGKSAIAVALAQATGGVVINADASQVYADLSVLSARPTAEEMGDIPHRLFGHVDGGDAYSAARWAAEAKAEIAAAHQKSKLPILVGGTGMYVRTLLDGIAPVPDIMPDIRARVRAMPVTQAHDALMQHDPDAAQRLAPADTTRVARALEVALSTGKPLSHWQAHMEGGIGEDITLRPLMLLPPRDWLIARCDARFEAMVAQGAVTEVERLLARGLAPELPVMRAIGVREIGDWIGGVTDHDGMLDRGRIATRQYAKRQYTWFSNQPPAHWPRETRAIDNKIIDNIVIKLQ